MKAKCVVLFSELQNSGPMTHKVKIVKCPAFFAHDIYILSIESLSNSLQNFRKSRFDDIVLRVDSDSDAIREGLRLWDQFMSDNINLKAK